MLALCLFVSIGAPALIPLPISVPTQHPNGVKNEINTTNYLDLIEASGLRTHTDAQPKSSLTLARELARCKEDVIQIKALKDKLLRMNNDYYEAWRDNEDLVRKDTKIFEEKNLMIDNLRGQVDELHEHYHELFMTVMDFMLSK